ncbi:MAG: HIT family protein [Rhizobacter sp.]
MLIAQGPRWRVIRADDAAFPAFYRVVWTEHVGEFSELPAARRAECMEVVCAVEQVLIDALRPARINLAALGNLVPHLHWHVIARFEADSHFPQPIWGVQQRESVSPLALLRVGLPQLDEQVAGALAALCQRL